MQGVYMITICYPGLVPGAKLFEAGLVLGHIKWHVHLQVLISTDPASHNSTQLVTHPAVNPMTPFHYV